MSANTVTISINNKDLPYTIDTYGMYNGESVEEGEQDYYASEYNLTEQEQFSLTFDYDHPAIVEHLSNDSIALIEQALQFETPEVVKQIRLVKSQSPQFYNYTTDSYTADWTIDLDALAKVTPEDWRKQALERGWSDDDLEGDNEIVAKLDLYLLSKLDTEDYEMSMFEAESSAYTENMTLDADSQKLIDSKERNDA